MSGDPLEGADVGETHTVRRSVTLYGINMEPDVYYGDDRFGEARIVDVEIVEDDREGYCDDVRVTWEGDLTKRLPSRWDYCREPRTSAERAAARRQRWLSRLGRALGILIPAAVVVLFAYVVIPSPGEFTINGEPVTLAPSPETMGLIFLLLALMVWAAQWAPRRFI